MQFQFGDLPESDSQGAGSIAHISVLQSMASILCLWTVGAIDVSKSSVAIHPEKTVRRMAYQLKSFSWVRGLDRSGLLCLRDMTR